MSIGAQQCSPNKKRKAGHVGLSKSEINLMFYLSLETGLGFDWMCNYDICVRVYTLLADSISMFMGAFFFCFL